MTPQAYGGDYGRTSGSFGHAEAPFLVYGRLGKCGPMETEGEYGERFGEGIPNG